MDSNITYNCKCEYYIDSQKYLFYPVIKFGTTI